MSEANNGSARRALTGQVIEVVNDHEVVINKGSDDGVTMDDRFLLYNLGDEMIDPETNENLGQLELVVGEGKPKHIQERFTTLTSSKVKTLRHRVSLFDTLGSAAYEPEEKRISVPFENVKRGCLFKQVR